MLLDHKGAVVFDHEAPPLGAWDVHCTLFQPLATVWRCLLPQSGQTPDTLLSL